MAAAPVAVLPVLRGLDRRQRLPKLGEGASGGPTAARVRSASAISSAERGALCAGHFHSSLRALTGTLEEIRATARPYRVHAAPEVHLQDRVVLEVLVLR